MGLPNTLRLKKYSLTVKNSELNNISRGNPSSLKKKVRKKKQNNENLNFSKKNEFNFTHVRVDQINSI
jgi:hypothetical protein